MNSEQPVEPTQSAPTDSVRPESSFIANSLLARTRWMQRALTPWTKQWLSRAAASTGDHRSGAAGRRDLSLALTVGAATQTLKRIYLQYESHSTRPVSGDLNDLPLAGALPQAAQPQAASATPEATGPYSKPFNSMEEFLAAVEASKARDYAPPPPEESAKPATQRTQGPYSKPFNSLEDFLKAVEAAKARNYAPPPEEEIAPPAPPREMGPYAHAFTSFEAFTKALEETRQKSGQTAPQAAAPNPTPSLSRKIRPMSRVEELPARGSSTQSDVPLSASIPASPPQPEPQSAESFFNPDELPSNPEAGDVASSPGDVAAPAPAQPAVIPPFSPVKARNVSPRWSAPKATGPQPASRQTVTASEVPTPVEPMPAVSPASPVIPLSDTAAVATETAVETSLPLVSPPSTEFSPSDAPEALPADVSITTRPAMETSPTRSTHSETLAPIARSSSPAEVRAAVTPAAPSEAASSPAISSTPAIQRAVEERAEDTSAFDKIDPVSIPQAQQPFAESTATALPIEQAVSQPIEPSAPKELIAKTAPAIQREVSEASVAPIPAQPESSAALAGWPVDQRQVSEPVTSTAAPEVARANAADLPLTSADLMSARSDLPLVQRQAVEQKPTTAAPQPTSSNDEAVASSKVHAISVQPVVQRQPNESLPSTAAPETAVGEIAEQSQAVASPDLPLVQRQAVEQKPITAAPQPSTVDDKGVTPAQPQAVPVQPVGQRQASESLPSTDVPETAAEEMAEQSKAVASRDLPLIQRQAVEQEPTAAAPQLPTVADKSVVPAQPQAVPVQSAVQRHASELPTSTVKVETAAEEIAEQSKAVASRDVPLVLRQTAEQKPIAAASQSSTSGDEAAVSSPDQAVPGQPVVQRRVRG